MIVVFCNCQYESTLWPRPGNYKSKFSEVKKWSRKRQKQGQKMLKLAGKSNKIFLLNRYSTPNIPENVKRLGYQCAFNHLSSPECTSRQHFFTVSFKFSTHKRQDSVVLSFFLIRLNVFFCSKNAFWSFLKITC